MTKSKSLFRNCFSSNMWLRMRKVFLHFTTTWNAEQSNVQPRGAYMTIVERMPSPFHVHHSLVPLKNPRNVQIDDSTSGTIRSLISHQTLQHAEQTTGLLILKQIKLHRVHNSAWRVHMCVCVLCVLVFESLVQLVRNVDSDFIMYLSRCVNICLRWRCFVQCLN